MALLRSHVTFVCEDGFNMPAYIAYSGMSVRPALIMLHDASGMSDEMKRIADLVAASGYVVMIPDLFGRGDWLQGLRHQIKCIIEEKGQVFSDILAARRHLQSLEGVEANRIGIMGFSIGAGFAMILARSGLFKVSAAFYGSTPKTLEGCCPIMASFGARDRVMTPRAVGLAERLQRLNIPSDIKVYENAGHGFMTKSPSLAVEILGRLCPLRIAFNRNASRDAFARLYRFLSQHL